MPDEALIIEIENIMADLVALGGENERTTIVPNLTVQDANPTNLDGFVIVSDDRDGDNILAKKVNSVIYSDNDLVNVIFIDGAEAVAFQQGSQSVNSGIWEIVPSTTTDIYYDKGNVGIGLSSNIDSDLVLNLNNWIGPAAISGNTVQGASYMEEGLVVNSDSEKEMIALKSPDVAHGMTTLAETDTAVSMRVFPGGFGGLQFTAYAEDDSAMAFFGRATNDNTDKSSAAYGPFVFNGQKKSGTSVGAMGANANVFCVQNNNSTVWFCDADGDTWQQGSVTLGTDIIHEGDADTKISFTADDIEFTAGNLSMLKLTEAAQDVIRLGPGSGDVDINFNGDMFLQGSDGRLGIGTITPDNFIDISTALDGQSGIIIQNSSAGTTASASIEFRNGGLTGPERTFFLQTGTGYTAVAGWQDAGVFSTQSGISGGMILNARAGGIKFEVAGNGSTFQEAILTNSGNFGIGAASPSAKLHVDQDSTTAAIPVLYLDQADVSEEMIEFNTTIGVGNAIEAVGAKSLTTTHFIKVTLPGGLTRYIPVGTIA